MSIPDENICYLNGDFLPLMEAKVSVLDRGFIFGDAIYEVIPVISGYYFALEEHLQRLIRNLAEVRIPNPLTDQEWRCCLQRVIEKNGGGNLSVYLQVSRGVAARDHAIPPDCTPTVFIMCKHLEIPAELIRIHAITREDNRWARCDIKSTSLLPNVLLRSQAIGAGAGEAILLRHGLVTEGAASNVFVVHSGVVTTPALGAALLPGITRGLLLETLRQRGVKTVQGAITDAQLRTADEIWITSSTRDLLAVSDLDGQSVGNGRNYPLAERTLLAFREMREQRASMTQTDPATQKIEAEYRQ